jgi:hypothetical protein
MHGLQWDYSFPRSTHGKEAVGYYENISHYPQIKSKDTPVLN